MNVGDIIVENGSEYEVLLDRSSEIQERHTLGLKNGKLHNYAKMLTIFKTQIWHDAC